MPAIFMQRIEEVKLTRSSIKWNKNTLKYKTLPFPRTLCCILGEKTAHAAFAPLPFAPPDENKEILVPRTP